jgi:23S rRNA pseudouridine2457 synthase
LPEQSFVLINKPFNVLSTFAPDEQGRPTLADLLPQPDLSPAGRLDFDSEGLLLATSAGWLQHLIAHPRHKLPKTYWVQVEGEPDEAALQALRQGVLVKGGRTRPAKARRIDPPELWPRLPPVQPGQSGTTTWLEMVLQEGRKRQVRHMTAAVGHPTLRLVRWAVGPWTVEGLQPGEWRELPFPPSAGAYFAMLKKG